LFLAFFLAALLCRRPFRLRVAKAYLDCKARHGALADRVK
jgi:hypothetical protein